MRLLALDQASRTTGYAVFEDDKLVKSGTFTLRSDDVGERLVDDGTLCPGRPGL